MSIANLFLDIPSDLPEELVETLVHGEGVRVERIVSRGHRSPEGFWYDQEQAEWVVVVTGNARLEFENGEVLALGPGDYLNIPAHHRHRVVWTDPEKETVWLAVYYRGVG